MVWSDLRQHPSEASVNASSRSELFWLFQRRLLVISLLTRLVNRLQIALPITGQWIENWSIGMEKMTQCRQHSRRSLKMS